MRNGGRYMRGESRDGRLAIPKKLTLIRSGFEWMKAIEGTRRTQNVGAGISKFVECHLLMIKTVAFAIFYFIRACSFSW